MPVEELKKEHLGDPAVRGHAALHLMGRVGINVFRLRLARRWTQTELAERAQTDQGRIARIEAGEVNLTLRRLGGLARALEVDPGELVRDPARTFLPTDLRLRRMGLEFAWNQGKARANVSKHGITFDEATSVFGDPLSATIHDPDHSQGEQRYLMVGVSDRNRLLVVSFADREGTIRIIGARLASRRERRDYEEEE
jgi:uncharacterized DUF497 family protein/DNA-binding Xre family transcriptional regulator